MEVPKKPSLTAAKLLIMLLVLCASGGSFGNKLPLAAAKEEYASARKTVYQKPKVPERLAESEPCRTRASYEVLYGYNIDTIRLAEREREVRRSRKYKDRDIVDNRRGNREGVGRNRRRKKNRS